MEQELHLLPRTAASHVLVTSTMIKLIQKAVNHALVSKLGYLKAEMLMIVQMVPILSALIKIMVVDPVPHP